MGAIELLLTQFVEEETRPTLRGAGYVLNGIAPKFYLRHRRWRRVCVSCCPADLTAYDVVHVAR